MTALDITNLQDADSMEAMLRRIGAERYHIHHPFHRLLHAGKLDKGQVQAWALNRYYYQSRIPMKDAALLSRCADRDLRREWLVRVLDHDGMGEQEGGIVRWLRLCEGLGLDPAYVRSEAGILPATKFAVDAYVRFVRDQTLLEAIASSLTELFAPKIHEERIPGMLAGYPFVTDEMMAYFRRRLDQAPRDAGFALSYAREHADTAEKRAAVCNALLFKCNVLWAQLDALHQAYVLEGGAIPPDAFVPEGRAGFEPARIAA
jgi:pyrroloquinoline-quinone synthase